MERYHLNGNLRCKKTTRLSQTPGYRLCERVAMKGADYNWSRIAILPKVMPILFSVRIRQIDDRTKRIIRTPINFDSRYLSQSPRNCGQFDTASSEICLCRRDHGCPQFPSISPFLVCFAAAAAPSSRQPHQTSKSRIALQSNVLTIKCSKLRSRYFST